MDTHRLVARIPTDIYDWLVKESKRQHRSTTAQLTTILEILKRGSESLTDEIWESDASNAASAAPSPLFPYEPEEDPSDDDPF